MHRSTIKHSIYLITFLILSAVAITLLSPFVDIKNIITVQNGIPETEALEQSTDSQEITINEPSVESDTADTLEPVQTEDYILDESKAYGSSYAEKLIYLGDKNTYAMGRYSYTGIPAPTQQVWSVEENVSPLKIGTVNNFIYPVTGETTNYLTAIKNRAPAYLILSFGSFADNETLTKERVITSLADFIIDVKQVSPNTQIMVQSIFPVCDGCTVLTNSDVVTRNEWLKEFCRNYMIYYLDTWSALVDGNGTLNAEYAAVDGYLLNEAGYKAAVDYAKNHAHPTYIELNEY